MLECLCETEFIELTRETYCDEDPETILAIYHCNTDINMSLWAKLVSCWHILTKGRTLLYDLVLTDAELGKLQDWVNSQPYTKC